MARKFSNLNLSNQEGKFEIRKMRPNHLPYVVAIERQSFPQPWSYSLFLSELSNRVATYLVAMWEGEIIGYLGLWTIADEGHITTLAIHPRFRGRGFGKRLLQYGLRFIQEKGCRKAFLEVRVSNWIAQKMYQELGFQPIGIRKRYYSDGEDALIMRRENYKEQ